MSRDRVNAAALFVIAAGAYLWTLCPSVYVEGSGELIGATWWLGTPHPTGYPLYTLLARLLAASMPKSSPAAAVNAATALLSAAVAPVLYLLLRERHLTRASAAVAATSLVFGRTFWSQAVIAEVYGLFVLCAVLVLAVTLKVGAAGVMRSRWLLLSGYVGGVAATCHLQAVLLLPSALGVALWQGRRKLSCLPADVLRVVAGGVGGASVFLYVMVRNEVGPGFHWGPLDSMGALWDHATGALYRTSFVLLSPAAVELALTRLAGQLASEWPVLLLPAVIWGVVIAWRRDRALAVAVLGAMGLNLAAGLGYHRDPAGVDVFFLLLLSCACVLMGVGLDDVDRRLRRHLRPAATAPIILACGVTVFIANLSDADRSGADLPDAYGRQLLEELPEDAILLTDGDDASYIVDYLHRVEGVRPDVTIYNRMGRGTDLGSGAELLSQRARLRRRREASLLESGRPVHFLAARKMPAAGFRFVPQGLSYRAVRDGPGEPAVELPPKPGPTPTALLWDAGRVRDPWVDKLAANCWYMEAEALREEGRRQEAIEAYERAATIAPRSQTMHYNVSVIMLRLNELDRSIKFAERAIEIDPLRRGPYELAASVLIRLGRREAARKVHKRALKWGQIP